jgi:ABC-type molybdate transport system ATPase subunit
MLLNISVNKATNFKWDTVDFKHKQEILPYLSLLHQQTHIPILYVTHSQQEVTHLADYVMIMEEGHVLASGTLPETMGFGLITNAAPRIEKPNRQK